MRRQAVHADWSSLIGEDILVLMQLRFTHWDRYSTNESALEHKPVAAMTPFREECSSLEIRLEISVPRGTDHTTVCTGSEGAIDSGPETMCLRGLSLQQMLGAISG